MNINDPMHIVGMRIKCFRVRKKFSQEKLAELSNLHMTYIGQLERGEKNPGLLSLLKIADALEVSPETLISKLGNTCSPSSDIPDKAYNLFLEMNENEAKELYKILSDIYLYKNSSN